MLNKMFYIMWTRKNYNQSKTFIILIYNFHLLNDTAIANIQELVSKTADKRKDKGIFFRVILKWLSTAILTQICLKSVSDL